MEIAMRHFYFHVRARDKLIIDDEGQDLPDSTAARREAELAARQLIADAIRAGKNQIPEAIVIADERGREVDIVPFVTVLPKAIREE
jgi:Domain of unknown function (DUF6894)